jgi:hypothetical protein
MLRRKKMALGLILPLFSTFLFGQTSNLNLKKYIDNTPISPNAAALTKYVGAGVSLNTGMVNYQIPIHEVMLKKINLPISLKYSSNGIRVNEAPSLTGMGWVLEAGGVITRQRNGGVDEYGQRIELPNNVNVCSQQFYDFIFNYSNPSLYSGFDTEPDLFTFSFAGYSGKFALDKDKKAFLLPKSNLKIDVDFTSSAQTFIITTPDGLKYYFGGNNATEETILNAPNRVCEYGNSPNDVAVKTAFYLNKIVSSEGESVNLYYDIYCFEQMPVNIIEICNNSIESHLCNGISACPDERETYYNHAYYRYRILREIVMPGIGRVEFNYASYNVEGSTNSYRQYRILNNIKVINNAQRQIKNFSLNYSYVQTTSGRGSLYTTLIPPETIRPFLSNVSNGPEAYSFEYENPQGLPVSASLHQDYWGFYNGQNNTNFIPNIGLNLVQCPEATANRNPYPQYAKFGMLKKITSPTGGYDLIHYEGNTTQQGLVGGVRVQKVVTHDNSTGASTTKKYYYAPINDLSNTTISGRGVIPQAHGQTSTGYVCLPPRDGIGSVATCTYQFTSSQPVNDLNIFGGNIVSYRYVTESIGGENFENGAVEHEFLVQNYNYAYPVMNGSLFDAPVNIDDYLNGLEVKTRVFKKNPSTGSFICLQAQENFYSYDPTSINDRIIGWKNHLKWMFSFGPSCSYPESDVIKTFYYRYWLRHDRTVSTTWDENGNNPVVIEEKYYYNNNQHLQVTKKEKYDSKGLLEEVTMKYPHDFVAAGNVYEKMLERNIVNPAIEVKSVKNNETQLLKSNYSFDWFGDQHITAPHYIQTQKNANPIESRVRYHAYDTYGNVLELSQESGARISYLWNNGNSLMSAEVQNASYTQIAYTSFDGDSKGNWTYSGVPVPDNTAPTGIKVYNITAAYPISKSNLNSGTSYTVTYWTKNSNAFSIAGTQPGYPIEINNVNGWKLFEHKVSGQTSITISGSGFIDELRLYPVRALMKTYTYESLIGITSECDQNNRIRYYEYDHVGRLTLIRDQNRNIVKKICYSYYWMNPLCEIYYNQALSGTFTKQCAPGESGSQVVYTVPAGTFGASSVSSANLLAQNDINVNGQAYANAYGTCTVVCNISNCTGINKKCVNGVCETGIKVYTSSVQIGPHLYECTYHYEWSDGSWSQNYTEQSPTHCQIILSGD